MLSARHARHSRVWTRALRDEPALMDFLRPSQDWLAFKPDEALVKSISAGPSLDLVSLVTAAVGAEVDEGAAGASAGSAGHVATAVDGDAKRKIALALPAAGVAVAGGDAGALSNADRDDKDSSDPSSGTDPQLASLVAYSRRCEDLLAVARNGIQLLDELEAQHRVVASKTKELHASCKKLTEEQVHVCSSGDSPALPPGGCAPACVRCANQSTAVGGRTPAAAT
jgi:hypothetical protein